MPQVELKELFDESRFPSGWKIFPLLLYFPLGVVLAIIRCFIGLQAFLAASLLPHLSIVRSFVLRVMCVVLGIIVKQEDSDQRDTNAQLIVSNHVTPFDHLAIHLVTSCITPSMWDLPGPLNWALGVRDLGAKQGRETMVTNFQRHFQKSKLPILVHPEGSTTSGRVGLLKFKTWPFSMNCTIQPLVISTWRPPVAELTPTVLCSRWWSDLFWFLFVPCTVFSLKYLPTVRKEEGEEVEEFTDRVEEVIADQLQVHPTRHTQSDKAEYEKRLLVERNQSVVIRAPHQLSPELQRMARQVNEVLPYVPLDVIIRDLVRSRSVDLTISNILEGLVTFIPEVDTRPSRSNSQSSMGSFQSCSTSGVLSNSPSTSTITTEESPSQKTCQEADGYSSSDSSSLDTSAPSFAPSAQARMMSFQERKSRLIENARKRYIEKHGLKIVGYNC